MKVYIPEARHVKQVAGGETPTTDGRLKQQLRKDHQALESGRFDKIPTVRARRRDYAPVHSIGY